MRSWLPNAISSQLVWIAAVWGAAHGYWWFGPVAVALFAAWQLPLSAVWRSDVAVCVAAAAMGFVVDTVWVQSGLFRFATPWPSDQVAPVWIVALWIGFALTVNHSLASLKSRMWLAVLLGAFGGPLAYAVAARTWHAVEIDGSMWIALGVLGATWAVVVPVLFVIARGFAPVQKEAVL